MLEEYIKCIAKEYSLETIEQINSDAFRKTLRTCKCLLQKADDHNVYAEWKNIHEFRQAGISEAGVVLLMYSIIIDFEANLDMEKIEQFIPDYFKHEFSEENVLGVYHLVDEEKKKNLFICFAYPFYRRVLDPRPWEFREKMLPEKWKSFLDKMQIALGVKQKLTKEEKYLTEDNREMEEKTPIEYTTPLYDSTVQLVKPYEDVMKRYEETYNYFYKNENRIYSAARRGDMHQKDFLSKVRQYLDSAHKDLANEDKNYIVKQMYTAIYEYYKLTPLINDPRISDIKVIAIDDIRVKVKGKRYTSNVTFDNEEDYQSFVEGIAIRNGINLQKSPMSHFVDKDGSDKCIMRFNIMTPYVASSSSPYIHIRKIPKQKPSLNQLITDGMLTKDLAQWLIEKVKSGRGMIFVGKGGSGKTVLMNVLLEYIPFYRSVMICQDNEELFAVQHPDCMFVHTVEAMNGRDESDFPVFSLKDITKNGLLVDIDYFIIGEIKGAEAMYFLNASRTGAQCMASLHDTEAKLNKLADYVMYESKYNRSQALNMLKNIQYIVHMDGYKVMEINETLDWNDEIEDLEYREVYNYKTGMISEKTER